MTRRTIAILAACLVVAATGCGDDKLTDETPKSAEGSPEAAAKQAVRAFASALNARDRAAVLKSVDAPYFDHESFGVVKDRAELERGYDRILGVWTKEGPLPKTIAKLARYRETRAALGESVRQKLDAVLAEEDFIVTLGDGPDVERYILVRVRDGAAKVVGVTTR